MSTTKIDSSAIFKRETLETETVVHKSKMSEYEREEYYRQRAAEVQRGIVNFKSSTTLTSESFIWTYRTTSVDVISLITTTVPIKNGAMNDIKIENREIKRLTK